MASGRSVRCEHSIDVGMRMGMRARTVSRQLGVELADEIQMATANG